MAHLATVRRDGAPHVVPIVFALEGDTICSAVDQKPKRRKDLQRLANIAAHPRVTVIVDHYAEEWRELWWVRADGRARIVRKGRERDRALELLTRKYPQYAVEPPTGPAVLVAVESWRAWP